MPTLADHAELLSRADYPVPPGATLTDAERQTVARFGHWMQALTIGTIAPATPEQEHFVLAARGMEDPTTPLFYKGIRVTFARGRITFDNKALQVYSVANPDILRFRKVGQPTVCLRYVAADAPPPQRNDEADADTEL